MSFGVVRLASCGGALEHLHATICGVRGTFLMLDRLPTHSQVGFSLFAPATHTVVARPAPISGQGSDPRCEPRTPQTVWILILPCPLDAARVLTRRRGEETRKGDGETFNSSRPHSATRSF